MKMCENSGKFMKIPETTRNRNLTILTNITSILLIDRQCNQFTKKSLENWKLDKGQNQKIILSKNPNKIRYKKITCSFPSITHRNQLVIYLPRSIAHLVLAETLNNKLRKDYEKFFNELEFCIICLNENCPAKPSSANSLYRNLQKCSLLRKSYQQKTIKWKK